MVEVSVVVPVYNVENEIRECINSIIEQSYDNWELILVDDGSIDNSGKICDEYAHVDKRINVYHKQNGGVSSARNFGLRKAHGEWITFVDSDDVLIKSFFSDFFKAKQNNPYIDLFIGNVLQQRTDGSTFVEYEFDEGLFNLRDSITINKLLKSGDLHSKLFKTAIIAKNKIEFNENIHYSEDRLFFDSYLFYSDSIYISSCIHYKYKRNAEGLSYCLNSFDSENKCLHLLFDALKKIGEKTSLNINDLFHNSPSERTIRSLYLDCNYEKSRTFFSGLDNGLHYFINRTLKTFNFGSILSFCFIKKYYLLLHIVLTFLMIAWQQKRKK